MKFRLQRLSDEEIDVDPHNTITFPQGIAPFEASRRYQLFHEDGHPSVFWLQSLDDPEVIFSLADPDRLQVSYEIDLTEAEQSLLQAAEGDDLLLAVILYRDGDAGHGGLQVNTRAPIVINASKRIGFQKVLHKLETAVTIKGA